MKKIIFPFILVLAMLGCTNEGLQSESENLQTNVKTSNSKAAASTSSWGDYNIQVSVSADGTEWTYTINKTKTNAKTLSHFIINLDNCGENSATFSDVIYATVNGLPTDLSTSEGSGTGCNPQSETTNFVKFPSFTSANTWVLVIKFSRGYEIAASSSVWIKAGTSCNQGLIQAPGCPKKERCSYSQGFFFANGSSTNGASEFWQNNLVIGGYTYTQAQGNLAWTINNGPGKDTTLNAFFQLGAVRLSGVENEVATEAAIIDAYFGALSTNVLGTIVNNDFVLPLSAGGYTKAQVKAAGSAIGSYIDANHCQ